MTRVKFLRLKSADSGVNEECTTDEAILGLISISLLLRSNSFAVRDLIKQPTITRPRL